MIIATSCSTGWYPRLVGLIGSIHQNNFDQVKEIMVFDIGLKPEEYKRIASLQKVRMCTVPLVNPLTLTEMRARQYDAPGAPRYVGLMTWKPAALKVILDEHEQAIYLDAGVTVWSKLDNLWDHIRQVGYFFVGCDNINWCTTTYVRETLKVEQHILDTHGINAGMMGISRQISDSVVNPCYKWAENIQLFVDDGTAAGGLTSARHEQTLLSILAARAGLDRPHGAYRTLHNGAIVHITDNKHELNDQTILYQSRGDTRFYQDKYLKYRDPTPAPTPAPIKSTHINSPKRQPQWVRKLLK